MIPLDYTIFAFVALLAFFLIHLFLKTPDGRGSVTTGGWLTVIAVLVAGYFLVRAGGNREKNHIQGMVEGFAPTYAQELSRMGHDRIGFDTPGDDPSYLSMIEAQIRWLRANPGVHDIYTFKKTDDGRVALLVDSETDYDRDGQYKGARETRTPIGEIYDEVDEGLEMAFDGVANFDSIPVSDRWGTWVSAFVPMYDREGRVDAVLGVDYSAEEWIAAIRRGRFAAMGCLTMILLILGGSFVSIGNLRSQIRKRKKIEDEYLRAKRAAETASVAKGQFLANMSHEIRTPLNGVIGMIELLRDTKLTTQQKEYLEAIKESSFDLSNLLSDILDLSKIEAGKLNLDSVPFALRDATEGTIRPLKYRAETKGLTLSVHVDHEIPERLVGDPARFRQILSNLVANALKFTERGGVAVELIRELEEPDSTQIRLTVSDTGIGIPRHKHTAVFDLFTQSDGSITRRYGGTGLGLAIVAHLVRLMGGRIWVESEEGHGSRFHVTLTFAHPSPKEAERSGISSDRGVEIERPLRILLAEDTATSQHVLVHLLEKGGHQVAVASNGREALELFKARKFDIILMDVQMPDMDGLEATRLIREREAGTGGHVPIIAMTAHALTGDRDLVLGAGMDDYLTKPIDLQKLVEAIRRWTGSAPPSLPSPDRWTPDHLTAMTGGDRDLTQEVIQLFEKERKRLQNEIRRAIRSKDAHALQMAAHALRGAVGNFRYQEAFDEAMELEKMGREGNVENTEGLVAKLETSLDRLSQLLQNL